VSREKTKKKRDEIHHEKNNKYFKIFKTCDETDLTGKNFVLPIYGYFFKKDEEKLPRAKTAGGQRLVEQSFLHCSSRRLAKDEKS